MARIIDGFDVLVAVSNSEVMNRFLDGQNVPAVEMFSMFSNCLGTAPTAEEYEHYKKLGDLTHLQELVKADNEGRIVLMPCQIGETVYEVNFIYKCDRCVHNHYGSCKYDGQDVECPRSVSRISEIPFSKNCFSIHTEELQHNIFLTRAEAEAALAKIIAEKEDEHDGKND